MIFSTGGSLVWEPRQESWLFLKEVLQCWTLCQNIAVFLVQEVAAKAECPHIWKPSVSKRTCVESVHGRNTVAQEANDSPKTPAADSELKSAC